MIYYKKRRKYKYNLHNQYAINTGIKADRPGQHGLLNITAKGMLTIGTGYSWDGPSGISVDTTNFMRGSLVHDALYQLMREGIVDIKHKGKADRLLRAICRTDGMSRVRAWYVWRAVKRFGKSSCMPDMLEAGN